METTTCSPLYRRASAFPKIRGTFLGVPIVRIVGILGSILGSPNFGKLLHVLLCTGEPLHDSAQSSFRKHCSHGHVLL